MELAIWALRLRVWDYFTKPVGIDELVNSIAGLPEMKPGTCKHGGDYWAIQPLDLPESRSFGTTIKKIPTALATTYVREHLDKKISLEIVSKLCGMSKSHFSRSFKNDHGITFQNYLAQQRIDRALALLKDSDMQVTQVAFAVGFTELSNFTRTFQRHIGMSPSYYRKAITSRLLQIKDRRSQSTKFPKANPNPVLSVGPDGLPDFVNPAASYLLKEIGLENVEYILPTNHRVLVKTSLDTNMPMSEERRIAGRTIVWSYCPIDDSETVHLYGNDVSDYVSDSPGVESISRESTNPVLSLEPDGEPRFMNSATCQLLEELKLENIEEILPSNHTSLLKACLKTSTPLAEECRAAGRTIIWSYHPANSNDVIYVYGQEVSGCAGKSSSNKVSVI